MLRAQRMWLRLQALFHPHRIAHKMNDEIQFHFAFLEPIFQVFIAMVLVKRSTLAKGFPCRRNARTESLAFSEMKKDSTFGAIIFAETLEAALPLRMQRKRRAAFSMATFVCSGGSNETYSDYRDRVRLGGDGRAAQAELSRNRLRRMAQRRHSRSLQPRKSTMLSFGRYPSRSSGTSRSLRDRCSRISKSISSRRFQPRDCFGS